MRAVVQRVTRAGVDVDGKNISQINNGLLVLLGAEKGDREEEADFLADKIVNLRIFEDDQGKLNLSLKQVKGKLLVVSQFTLLGDCQKGRRPSFTKAEAPDRAKELYQYFMAKTQEAGVDTRQGQFQALMEVSLVNHGPVTLILDTRQNSK